jgi:hypothetical protein
MGVGAIRFRRVACSATAANPAPPIASTSPAEKGPDSPRPDQQVRGGFGGLVCGLEGARARASSNPAMPLCRKSPALDADARS